MSYVIGNVLDVLPGAGDDDVETVRAALRPLRNRIRVALFSFGNPFAIGAAIRVSHSFLVDEILIVGDAPFYEKASMGMEKYETIVRLADGDEHTDPREETIPVPRSHPDFDARLRARLARPGLDQQRPALR